MGRGQRCCSASFIEKTSIFALLTMPKPLTVWITINWPGRLLCPWDSLGKNTGVGCHILLQGIFPTQESIWGLLHCRWILNQLSHKGSLRILPFPSPIIHTVKGFGIVSKAEIDAFLELSCFFHDPADVGNLISGRGNPACRGTFGGRRKAVRDRLALQGGTGDFP